MNTDIAAGKWKELKGKVRAKWGQLTDDEFDKIAGKREEFAGILQQRYGVKRDQAEEYFDDLRDNNP